MYCNRCGARLQQGTVVCPDCGARQRRQTRSIRCARCRGRASIEMTVCPHCGRNLMPAGPRWSLWIPLALLLAFAVYWGRDKAPVEQIKQGAEAARTELSGMVQLPELATPTPGVIAGRPAPITPTPSATRTATATATRPPSATPSPSPTATAAGAAREYTVEPGDSLALIGEKLDLPWRTIAAINGLTEFSILRPGDKLRLPTPTPAPIRNTATATPTAVTTATATATATLRSTGAADDASPTAAATGASAPTATATPSPAPPSPTRAPLPTATPTPTATPAPQLAAPILLVPGDQNAYSGDTAQVMLEWQSPAGLPRGAVYRLTIAWVEKGAPISWTWDATSASVRAASWLWQRADQPARQYTWFVQIIQVATDGKGGERVIPLSPPSEKRVFYWY